MRVTHLTASTFYGGPERQMLGLADHLPSHYKTTFLSFSEGGRCAPFLEIAKARGYRASSLKNDTPWLRAATTELTKSISDLGTSILCCHGYKAALLGRIAARRQGIPVVAISRGWTAESWKVSLYELLDKINLRWMDAIVCVSEAQAQRVAATGAPGSRIEMIPNAIDPDRFTTRKEGNQGRLQSLFSSRRRLIVGAAGRLSPEKGFDLFIEAAIQLADEDESLGFVHFGNGILHKQLSEKIHKAGAQDRVILAGFRDDLDELLPQLDLMILPSYTEGMPNVVLEAQAAGAPVIATAVGGTPEIIEHGNTGLLIKPGSIKALTAAMRALITDDTHRQAMATAGQHHVRQSFTFHNQAERYHKLFLNLLEKQEPAQARLRKAPAGSFVK